MPLNTLTLGVTSGVIGRPFRARVNGVTAGSSVVIANGSALGFGYSNGFVTHPSLPQDLQVVRLTERKSGDEVVTSEIAITAVSEFASRAAASLAGGTSYRAYAALDANGNAIWSSAYQAPGGALVAAPFDGGSTPTPTPNPDTTPDTFSFVDQTGVERGTEITSAPVTITGINQPASWSVTGGTAQVGSGPFAGTGTVAAGETMRVRLTSSASYSTVATATLTVGGVSDAFSVTTLAEPVVTPTPTSRMATFVVADIDPANERDDEQAIAMLLADQTRFNVVGLVADAPDGITTGYSALTTAYEADRSKLEAATGNTGLFLTKAQLDARTVQGSKQDAPSGVGYWTQAQWEQGGEPGAGHAAAQALIAAAQAHGSPTGTPQTNPFGKLWVFVQGGWSTIAQALYEAIDLGQLPDILKRVAFLGQSTHNSFVTNDAWLYINSNQWQDPGVPGKFGDMWCVDGCYLWTGLNRRNDVTDTQMWNAAIYGSAMGAALEAERAASNYKELAFRAGDAGAWFWLSEAIRLNNFDPTNSANRIGPYRTYQDGQGWPYNRSPALWGPSNAAGGWPTGPGNDPLYSPTRWGPVESVDSIAAGIAALDLDSAGGWNDTVRRVMARYRGLSGISEYLTGEWLLDAGAAATTQTIASTEPGMELVRGGDSTVEAADPAWTASGLSFNGSQLAFRDRTSLTNRQRVTVAAVFKPSTIAAGTRQIVARSDNRSGATSQFQLRQNGATVEFVGQGTTPTILTSAALLTTDRFYLAVAHVDLDSRAVRLEIDGQVVATGTLAVNLPTGGTARLAFGARFNNGSVERFQGEIAYVSMFDSVPLARLPQVTALARSRATAKGITIP